MKLSDHIRIHIWAWWHMRPGHHPHVLRRIGSVIICGACGSPAPTPRD